MNTASYYLCNSPVASRLLGASLVLAAVGSLTGCGGKVASRQQPLSGNTSVTILSSSTANDKLFQFSATIDTLTLISKSGKTTSLLTKPLYPEFMHLNGTLEPLVSVSIPQDVYTSAAATLGPTGFTCAALGPNGVMSTGFFGYTDSTPASNITVSLPAPITVVGDSMVLSFNLLVSQSANYPSCYTTGIVPFSVTPSFSLTPMTIAAQPVSSANGKLLGLEGLVASVDSSAHTVVVKSADGSNYGGSDAAQSDDPADGPNWQILFDKDTVFQGIGSPSQLAIGQPVDIDAAIQSDGSVLATRVALYDTETTNTSFWVVPALYEDDGVGPRMFIGEKEQVGPILGGDGSPIYFVDSAFSISEQMTNLADLPFQASFTAANMVAGQNIGITFHEQSYGNSITGPSPTTITLLPQTINGTISTVGSEGGFTTYTVTLAPYDLFPALAVQPGQTTLLTKPNTVIVYADSNTQRLNASPIAVGSVVRFYGLVFNDNGTLRMDCAQINDGVPE